MKYMLLIYGNEELWGSFPAGGVRQQVVDRDQRAAGRAARRRASSSAPTASPTR